MMITHSNVKALDSRQKKNREPVLDLFIHLITKDILNTKPLKISDNLTKQEREPLNNPTECNDVVITPADKGKPL